LTSLGCPKVLTQNCNKNSSKNWRKDYTFVWNNDPPPYAHCVPFGGNCLYV